MGRCRAWVFLRPGTSPRGRRRDRGRCSTPASTATSPTSPAASSHRTACSPTAPSGRRGEDDARNTATAPRWPEWRQLRATTVRASPGPPGTCKIMPVKISEDGDSDTVMLAEAIEYARRPRRRRHQRELRDPAGVRRGPDAQGRGRVRGRARGSSMVAAAGNEGASSVGYPAALPGSSPWERPTVQTRDGRDADERVEHRHRARPGGARRPRSSATIAPRPTRSPTTTRARRCPLRWWRGWLALMLSADPSLTPERGHRHSQRHGRRPGPPPDGTRNSVGVCSTPPRRLRRRPGPVRRPPRPPWGRRPPPARPPPRLPPPWSRRAPPRRSRAYDDHDAVPRLPGCLGGDTPYWYEIEYLAAHGIVAGFARRALPPERRAQAAAVREDDHPHSRLLRDRERHESVHRRGRTSRETSIPITTWRWPTSAGITEGTAPGHFSPYRTLTRAQLITMVVRAAQLPEPPRGLRAAVRRTSRPTHYPYRAQGGLRRSPGRDRGDGRRLRLPGAGDQGRGVRRALRALLQ